MATTCCQTLILATGIASVRQWINELLERTTLTEEQVGEFSGERKQIRPVTVTTYQILTHRLPLENFQQGIDLVAAGDRSIKVTLAP